jgi:hypothetical protein
MSHSRIKQYSNGVTTNRESTRQHCCALWNVSQGGEVEFTLLDLHHWLLDLVPLTEPGAFTLLVLPGLRALISIVSGLPTIIAVAILDSTVVVVSRGCIRLEWLLLSLAELKVPRWLVLRRDHPPVSS